ncbi:fructosamine kinase [Salibacterium salarium]|uniref:Fructosamine kinase n=1 Tax=Salibacterium salarium TaxID=284579 RepID=A0A3R9PBA7_9BACI|nr:fructosamine kinase family protein [Salibacterium salarium]RSL34596.1 fructosamine kinase [Salibacterium salarium]
MKIDINKALRHAGINEEALDIKEISGGSISKAFTVETKTNKYFVKWHEEAPTDFFRQESLGLQFLEEAEALNVPTVYGWDKKFIVMELINGKKTATTEEELGHGIAALHSCQGSVFGLEEDNFIGELPQINAWDESWIPFLRNKRLLPQIELARSLGRLSKTRAKYAYYILDHLEKWVPDHDKAVKLHGDLWSGNWLADSSGHPYFIDPAVWYGDFEFELAFTYLFGGFSDTIYAAYNECNPIDKLFEERKPLYQLYYLLVHLNIFGESYGSAVDKILSKYAK